jgi:hypothetical protein
LERRTGIWATDIVGVFFGGAMRAGWGSIARLIQGAGLSDERLDYAILISLAMREEAEVMASALRAEGIDAILGNGLHMNTDWHLTLALGGVQVLVPGQKMEEARAVIRERIKDAAENPDGEPVGRRDRWKLWAVIAFSWGLPTLVGLAALWLPADDPYDGPAAVETPP